MSLITYVTRIHFADRVLEDALPEEMQKLSARRPLLVLDAGAAGPEARERVEDALPPGSALQAVWLAGGACHDSGPAALARAAAAQDCDIAVAVGGPAALDLARAAFPAGPRATPLIAIPTTTAGVGLGPASTLPSTRRTGSGARIPTVILCDPTLTTHAGAAETAAAGMDALTHCVEAYLGTAYNPPADGIAIEGVRRAAAYLERAVSDGGDLEARRELLAAALNAGLAAQKGQGGIDAAARAVEAEAGLTARHGICHVALLPPVLNFNAPAVEDRFEALRQALALGPRADLSAALADLGARVGLPRRLSALGIKRAVLPRVARSAAADPANRTNPRHATEDDYLGILEAAL